MPNILDYFYGIGFELLDQTLPADGDKKRTETNMVRLAIFNDLSHVPDKYSQIYGITFTFKPKFYTLDPDHLHSLVRSRIEKSTVCRKCKYYLIPQFTPKGNLHYHGVVYDCYQVPFMKMVKWWRRNFGFSKPELTIRHYDKWIRYITRDMYITGLSTIWKVF